MSSGSRSPSRLTRSVAGAARGPWRSPSRPRYAIALEATGFATGRAEIGDVEAMVHVRGQVGARHRCPSSGRTRSTQRSRLINELPKLGLDAHEHDLLGDVERGDRRRSRPAPTSTRSPTAAASGSRSRSCPGRAPRRPSPPSSASRPEHGGRVELIEVTEPFETPPDSPLVTRARCRDARDHGRRLRAGRRPRLDRRPQLRRLRRLGGGRLRSRRFRNGPHSRGAHRRRAGGRVRGDLHPAGRAGLARLKTA